MKTLYLYGNDEFCKLICKMSSSFFGIFGAFLQNAANLLRPHRIVATLSVKAR